MVTSFAHQTSLHDRVLQNDLAGACLLALSRPSLLDVADDQVSFQDVMFVSFISNLGSGEG